MREWPFCRTSEPSSLLHQPRVVGTVGLAGGGVAPQNIWSLLGVHPLQTQARMSKLTRTPSQTRPGCRQRSSFSWTPRKTRVSRKGAGPGASARSSFLVSLREALEAEPGRGEHAPCTLRSLRRGAAGLRCGPFKRSGVFSFCSCPCLRARK